MVAGNIHIISSVTEFDAYPGSDYGDELYASIHTEYLKDGTKKIDDECEEIGPGDIVIDAKWSYANQDHESMCISDAFSYTGYMELADGKRLNLPENMLEEIHEAGTRDKIELFKSMVTTFVPEVIWPDVEIKNTDVLRDDKKTLKEMVNSLREDPEHAEDTEYVSKEYENIEL